jgi:hypothetical protein
MAFETPNPLLRQGRSRRVIESQMESSLAAEIVWQYGLGVTAPPDNPASIAALLARLIGLQATRICWPGIAEAQRDFDRRRLSGDLAALSDRVIAEGPDAGS